MAFALTATTALSSITDPSLEDRGHDHHRDRVVGAAIA